MDLTIYKTIPNSIYFTTFVIKKSKHNKISKPQTQNLKSSNKSYPGLAKIPSWGFSWGSFGRTGPELRPSCDQVETNRIQQARKPQFSRRWRPNYALNAC